jgi:hypothetical protein
MPRRTEWEPYLTKRDPARRYRVTTRTIEIWQSKGMPSRLRGGKRLYRESEVEAWHEEQKA